HRVIARGGALQGYAGGLDLKARLLAMEQALPTQVEEQARLF
ncbi:MAG: cysteine methyltransferase, partial [Deltaproteobacteria bacterium]|nr:cysteine methyltransferase [Deltaproteobacteria bacterium]